MTSRAARSQEVPKLVYDFTEGNKDLKDLLAVRVPTWPR